MIRVAAIVAFILAIIFYCLSVGSAPWTWTLFTLIGLACVAADGFPGRHA